MNILDAPAVTAAEAKAWARARGATGEFVNLADLYWELAPARGGVRADVAYLQAGHETNWGRFGGVLTASFHNPCGLKTSRGGGDADASAHARFRTWRLGVTAHLDHLALYAGAAGYPRQDTPDPRHFKTLRGTAATVEDLGGKWAPSPDYGRRVAALVDRIAPQPAAAQPARAGEPAGLDTRPIRLGETGERVHAWRRLLRRKGFEINATGRFDKRLRNATLVAQHWAGVPADGAVGPETWRAVRRKRRSRHPISTLLALLNRPRVIDARDGKAGFPRHPSRRWDSRRAQMIRGALGHYTGGQASFVADARFHVTSSYLTRGGAPAIAYTLGVDKDGTLYVFNDWRHVTWHCDGGQNTYWLGVVFRGAAEGPTLAQRRTLTWLWRQLEAGTFQPTQAEPPWPRMRDTTVHRKVTATSCPGDRGEAFYRQVASRFVDRP